MSSILDALNKLEEEKARAQEDAEAVDIDVHEAVEDLVGRSILRDRVTLRFTPGKLLIGGGLFVVALVAVSVGISVAVLGSKASPVVDTPADVVASSKPAPTTTEPTASVPDGEDNPAESVAEVAAIEVEKVEASVVPSPASVRETPPSAVVPEPVVAKEPVVAEQSTSEVDAAQAEDSVATKIDSAEEETSNAPEKPSVEREQVAKASEDSRASIPSNESLIEEPPAPAASVAIHTLPRLSPSDMDRYGLDNFRINMLKPQSASNPYAFAMINRKKVFEGSSIPGTRLVLFAVEMEGVGLHERGTSLRYFAPF